MIIFFRRLFPFTWVLLIPFIIFSCRSEPKVKTKTNTTIENKTVVVRLKSEPDFLIPILTTSSYSRKVYRHLHASLMETDPVTLELVPKLLIGYPKTVSLTEGEFSGGFRYDYEIREGANWDNGTPILAEDVIFTFKSILNPKVNTRYRPGLDFAKDIVLDKSNPRRFSVYTNKCIIDAVVEIVTTQIYPKYYYDPSGLLDEFSYRILKEGKDLSKGKDSDKKLQAFADKFSSPAFTHQNPLGSGAYFVKEWISGQKIVLEKKKKWWGTAFEKENRIFVNKPETIIYKIVPDETAALTMAKAGELDIVSDVTFELYDELLKNETAKKQLSFFNPVTSIYYYFAFNTKKKYLSDKRVRRAIAHLLDVDKVMKIGLHGFGERISTPIMPYSPNFNPNLKLIAYDLEKSTQLLDDAGWKDSNNDGVRDKVIEGKSTELDVELKIAQNSVVGKLMAQLLEKSGKKVGVHFKTTYRDFRKMQREDMPSGNYDMASVGSRAHLPYNPNSAYHTHSFPPNGQNVTRFGNAESDEIIDRIISNCENEVQRKKDYFRFQAIIYDEQPMIYLFNARNRVIINKKFKNAKSYNYFPGYMENWLN